MCKMACKYTIWPQANAALSSEPVDVAGRDSSACLVHSRTFCNLQGEPETAEDKERPIYKFSIPMVVLCSNIAIMLIKLEPR